MTTAFVLFLCMLTTGYSYYFVRSVVENDEPLKNHVMNIIMIFVMWLIIFLFLEN